MLKILFFLKIVLLLTPYNSVYAEDNLLRHYSKEIHQLANSRKWLKLLHYYPKGDGYVSYQDSPLFFGHKNGKTNPFLELQKDIQLFSDIKSEVSISKMSFHPQCIWPARKTLIEKTIPTIKFPKIKCSKFPAWRDGLNAKSVSLIFSSAYANNPASMFGHTFLRLNQSSLNEPHDDLLDYTISFSANTGDQNGILYAMMGLFGYFRGYFSVEPYYLKVREYNRFENRDLWEYGLKLSEEEVDFLVMHLWELYSTSYFDYYFFDENCSFHILGLLEAARPGWDLTSRLSLFTAPNATVIDLKDVGAIATINLRPSLRSSLHKTYETMSYAQRRQFSGIISKRLTTSEIKDVKVFDTYLDYLAIQKVEKNKNFTNKDREVYHQALVARAKLPPAHKEIISDKINRPDIGHRVSRMYFSYSEQGSRTYSFGSRFGFHDLLQIDAGYEEFSEASGLEFQIGYNIDQQKILLDKLNIVQIKSLHSFEFYDPDISWEMGSSIDKSYYGDFHNWESYYSMGISKKIVPKILMYALGGIRLDISGDYDKGYLEYLRANTGLIYTHPWFKIHLNLKMLRPLWNRRDYHELMIQKVEFGHGQKNYDVKLGLERIQSDSLKEDDYRLVSSIGYLY